MDGKVAVVTGAASGIGLAVAIALARRGVKLVLADISGEEVLVTAKNKALHANPKLTADDVTTIVMDVSVEEDVERMVQTAVDHYGRLDMAFNNAGFEGVQAPIADSATSDFLRTMAVNATGTYLCLKYELKQMLKQKQQSPDAAVTYSIVNTSSVAGLRPMPEIAGYSASKHAIIALTKTAAQEYAQHGIRVNALCPSITDTPMLQRVSRQSPERIAQVTAVIPMARMGTVEEMANAVVWMLSDECPYMSGTCMEVNGASC